MVVEEPHGGVEMSVHLDLFGGMRNTNKIASVVTLPLAIMMASGAAAPIAPLQAVSGGESTTRRGMTLGIALSGHQSSAPVASPLI